MSDTEPRPSSDASVNESPIHLHTNYTSTLKQGYECKTIEELLTHVNSLAKQDGFALILDSRGNPRVKNRKNDRLRVVGERLNPRFICQKGNHIEKSKPKVFAEGEDRKRDRRTKLEPRETACKYKITFKVKIIEEDGKLKRIWSPSSESHEHNHPASCPLTTASKTPHRRQWLLKHKERLLDLRNDGIKRCKVMAEIESMSGGDVRPVTVRDLSNLWGRPGAEPSAAPQSQAQRDPSTGNLGPARSQATLGRRRSV